MGAASLLLKDASGNDFSVAAESGSSGLYTPHSVPEIGGAAVSTNNPMPVSAVQGGAWSVVQGGAWSVAQSGNWSMSATLQLAGSAISASNPLPVSTVQSGTWAVQQSGNWTVTQSGSWSVSSTPFFGGAAVSFTNPLPVSSAPTIGGTAVSTSNPVPVFLPAGTNIIGIVAPVVSTRTSRSVTTVAGTSTQLFPSNTSRKYIRWAAPQTTGIWVNDLGGTAGPNLADCYYWPPGSIYESSTCVTPTAVNYYCATAGRIIPACEA